jgi:hypothetical protein
LVSTKRQHDRPRITTRDASGIAIIDDSYTRDAGGRITAIAGLTPSDSWPMAMMILIA